MLKSSRILLGVALLSSASLAQAQEAKGPWRTRISLGAAIVPNFPGADDTDIAPTGGISRARGDKPFAFGSPDDSLSIGVLGDDMFDFGPAVNAEGKRKFSDTAGRLPEVKFSVELGGFVQITPANFRLRLEARQGVSGHDGFVANLSADYVVRDADRWLFSIGPRVQYASGKYNRAYFGVPVAAAPLAAYRPGSGINAIGGTATARFAISDRIGVFGYGKYDRLVDDAGRSPYVRTFGARDQYSGGVGLSYTFGG